MSQPFHPEMSRVNSDTLADFIRAPLQGHLSEVPGIGPGTEKILRQNGINTSFGLIGKFLMLREEGVDSIEHAERFYLWLKSIGTPTGFRGGIVVCICEKVNVMFPGTYDPDLYEPTVV